MLDDQKAFDDLYSTCREALGYMAGLITDSSGRWVSRFTSTIDGASIITHDRDQVMSKDNHLPTLSETVKLLGYRDRINDLTVSIMDGTNLYLAIGLMGGYSLFRECTKDYDLASTSDGPPMWGHVSPKVLSQIRDKESAVLGLVKYSDNYYRTAWCKHILQGGSPLPILDDEKHSVLGLARGVQQLLMFAITSVRELKVDGSPNEWMDASVRDYFSEEMRGRERHRRIHLVEIGYKKHDLQARTVSISKAIGAGFMTYAAE